MSPLNFSTSATGRHRTSRILSRQRSHQLSFRRTMDSEAHFAIRTIFAFRMLQSSLPIQLVLTVLCNGCNIDTTDVYGFPERALAIVNSTVAHRRQLVSDSSDLVFDTQTHNQDGPTLPESRRTQEQTCQCDAALPRRVLLEADVTNALNPKLKAISLPCIGNTTTCDFGATFVTNILMEVQMNATLDLLCRRVELCDHL